MNKTGSRMGSLESALQSGEAFERIRSGFDFDRFPLVFPYHLLRVAGELHLCQGRSVVAFSVTTVGSEGQNFWGECLDKSGQQPQYWLLTDEGKCHQSAELDRLRQVSGCQLEVKSLADALNATLGRAD